MQKVEWEFVNDVTHVSVTISDGGENWPVYAKIEDVELYKDEGQYIIRLRNAKVPNYSVKLFNSGSLLCDKTFPYAHNLGHMVIIKSHGDSLWEEIENGDVKLEWFSKTRDQAKLEKLNSNIKESADDK